MWRYSKRRASRRRLWRLEQLEARAMLATFLVNQTFDLIDATAAADGVVDTSLATPGLQISLRAAIQEANALPGPDTIVLPAGFYALSRAGLGEDNAVFGDLDVIGDLTIDGFGTADNTTINASAIDRVFHVMGGSTLILEDVTITGGLAQPVQVGFVENGGGIYNSGHVELNNCVLSGNSIANFGNGGGIYNAGVTSRVTIFESTISNNSVGSSGTSGFGGGIYNFGANGEVLFFNSTLSGNTAVRGGGIYNATGDVSFFDSTVANNDGSFMSGGVHNVSGEIFISESTFTANTSGIGSGSGVFSNGGSVDIFRSLFESQATAIGNQGGFLSVTESTFRENTGAIGSFGVAVIDRSTFVDNSGVLSAGGPLNVAENLTATNNTFSGNQAAGALGLVALIGISGRATLVNNTIAGNTADGTSGTAGLRAENGATVRLQNNLIAGNTGTSSPDVSGAFISQGNNLIGNVGDATGFTNGANNDQVGGGGNSVIDPLLGPLQDNGGLTFTRALLAGSPAINTGANSGAPATDQRGVTRPQNAIVDIGAYEKFSGVATAAADTYVLGAGGLDFFSDEAVFENDTNIGGFNAILVTEPGEGNVIFDADGFFLYTPGGNFDGIDSFNYRGQLGSEATTNTVTVRILSHNALLVNKVYMQVLNREADPGGLAHWTAQVNSGAASFGAIASSIFESNERLDPIIRQMYRDYLFREADAGGLAHWRDSVWKRDGGPDNVIAGIISSDEFFASAGGTNAGWVTELYQRLLGRAPDQGGLNHWTGELNSGRLTRPQVVLGFVRSIENFRLLTRGWYQQYLGRAPTQQEENSAVNQMAGGASQRTIQIQLLDTLEYRSTPPVPGEGDADRV